MFDIGIYVVLGGVIGFLIGLTGVGGGVLAVPSLILIVRLPPIAAVGTASFYAVLTKLYAVFRHYRQGTVNWKVGTRFFAISLPGLMLTSLLVKYGKDALSPPHVEILQEVIGYIIILSIVLSVVALTFNYSKLQQRSLTSLHSKFFAAFLICLVGGVMGATSIGGGVLIIPALLFIFRETEKYVGTSIYISVLLMIVMSCIYAFLGHDGKFGDVNVEVAAFMALGSLLGAHLGSFLSTKIEPQRLQYVVIGVISIAIAMMLLDKMI